MQGPNELSERQKDHLAHHRPSDGKPAAAYNPDHNDEDSNWTSTTLPHLTSTNLQAEYPPISVPEDVLPDVDADQEDATYQQGMVIASEIAHEMLTRGRVRYSEA